MLNKIGLIIGREYLSRVKKKSFILTTLIAPLGFIVFFGFVAFVSSVGESEKSVLIIDESGLFEDAVFPSSDDGNIKIDKLDTVYHKGSEIAPYIGEDVTIVIPEGFDILRPERKQVICYTDKNLGLATRAYIRSVINDAIRKAQYDSLSISEESERMLNSEVQLSEYSRTEESKNSAYQAIASGIGFILGFAIYLALFIYGTMIMKGVMEEKTNRIVEVMASSVKPFELLIGKIVGIGAVGLTQFVLWGIMISIINIVMTPLLGAATMSAGAGESGAEDLDPALIQEITIALGQLDFTPIFLSFIFYFLGGYLLFGSLYAAIGAATSDDGDVQALSLPISLPIIASIIILMPVLNDPDGTLAFWASIFPLSSPIIMPARMAFNPPVWQLILSMALLLISFLGTTWIAARIYRVGILLYGKKVRFREIIKWAFYKEK